MKTSERWLKSSRHFEFILNTIMFVYVFSNPLINTTSIKYEAHDSLTRTLFTHVFHDVCLCGDGEVRLSSVCGPSAAMEAATAAFIPGPVREAARRHGPRHGRRGRPHGPPAGTSGRGGQGYDQQGFPAAAVSAPVSGPGNTAARTLPLRRAGSHSVPGACETGERTYLPRNSCGIDTAIPGFHL